MDIRLPKNEDHYNKFTKWKYKIIGAYTNRLNEKEGKFLGENVNNS